MMIKKNKQIIFNREAAAFVLIFLLALGLRLGIMLKTDDFHGVSNGKVLQARFLMENKVDWGTFYSPVHPPIHMFLLMAAIKLVADPLLAGRVVSLFFGMFLLVPFYLSVKIIFDKKIALFSMLAAALYSEHAVYSVIGTGETTFQFFLFLSLFLFLKSQDEDNPGFLFASAVSLGAASLCRYEGILFIPLLAMLLRKDSKSRFVFFCAAFALPAVWMLFNLLSSNDALLFINTNDFTVPLQFNWIRAQGVKMDLGYRGVFWPRMLMNTLGAAVFLFGACGVILSMRRREKKFFAVLFSALFAVFVLGTIMERVYVQARYSITLGLLLIPYAFYLFFELIKMLEARKIKLSPVVAFLLIGAMIPPIGSRVLAEPLYTPLFAKQTAEYMKKNLKPSDIIFLDHCGDEKYREPIEVLSGLNPGQFTVMAYMVPREGRWRADRKKFFEGLKKNRVNILIYSPEGTLKDILAFEKKNPEVTMEGLRFVRFHSVGPYLFYRISGGQRE